MSGPTATARLDGRVQGVVVHTHNRSPLSSRRATVNAGSCRSRYTSSIRVSVLDSGVSHRQQYASTRKPSYTNPLSYKVLNAHRTLSM